MAAVALLSGSAATPALAQQDSNTAAAVADGQTAATSASVSPHAAGARSFVDKMAGDAIAFLASKTMSDDQKRDSFRAMLMTDFDMNTIARFSLGTYWNQASPAQKQDYLKSFSEMIVRVYSARFQSYNGQKFQTRGARPDGDEDTIVGSAILPAPNSGNPEIDVDWRVRFKNGHYKIVDVVVEGVSMAVTQRSDFASVIQQNGGNIDALLNQLRAEANGQLPAQQAHGQGQ